MTQAISELMLKNSKIDEIKKLQALNAQRTDLRLKLVQDTEEKMLIALSTRYWTWHPFHYLECPDADTGDLYLSQEDLYSGLTSEIIQSFQLLDAIKSFLEYYRIRDTEGLKTLILD